MSVNQLKAFASTTTRQKQFSAKLFILMLLVALPMAIMNEGRSLAQDSTAPESTDVAPDYNGQGVAYQSQGNYEQAITAYLQALKLDPHYTPFELGGANVSNGDSLTSLLNQVDPQLLYQSVDALQRFQTRHVNSPDLPDSGIAAAGRYIKTQFENISASSNGNFQTFNQTFPLSWNGLDTMQNNIVGLIQGTDMNGGVILVGAHYDSITIDPNDSLYYAPGADDDASGVSALIELARILSVSQHHVPIMLVAFSAEETGRQGSRAFVQYLKEQQISIKVMFSLDIIGSQTGPNGEIIDNQIRIYSEGPNESPSRQLARTIQLIASAYTPQMSVIVKDSIDRKGRYSDHFSFNEAGWPAVRFIEPMEDGQRQHTPQDTIEDIQPAYLARATQTILAAVTVLADGPQPPVNIVLRANNDGSHTLEWETSPGAARYLIALRRPGAVTYLPSDMFLWGSNSVDWKGFDATLFAKVMVIPVDANGLMGAPSTEHPIW
jgi:tetratricopeptide (TPR) repeat protein